MRRSFTFTFAFVVFVFAGGCKPAGTGAAALTSIESVRERFNASSHLTRVLALLSPT